MEKKLSVEIQQPRYISKTQVFNRVSSIVSTLLVGIIGHVLIIEDIASIIVNASAEKTTINSVAGRSKNAPEAPTIRFHCRKLKGKGIQLVNAINRIFLEQARLLLKTGIPYEFAIDTNEKEFYTSREDKFIVKSKAKNGTNRFVSHATLYTMVGGKHVTIAFMRLRKGLPRAEIVQKLVEVLIAEGFCIKRLYLDRGFYSVGVIRYLKSLNTNAIIAMPIRGKKKGLRSRLKGRKSHWISDYPVTSTICGERITETHLIAVLATYQKNRRGKRGLRWYAYAVIGHRISLKRIRGAYRRRFGIETSYRIKNQSLGKTSSPMTELRTLYFGVSLLIQNEWVCTNWFYFRKRRLGRPSGKPVLHYDVFLTLLREGCKDVLGRLDMIEMTGWHPGGPLG